jgi:gamma-glutamyltranspeptidase/glutathione hydrolase
VGPSPARDSPNGQGIAALIALGIARHLDLGSLPADGALSQHLQIEAMKLGFADTYAHVADMRGGMRLNPAQMLDDAYLAERAEADRPEPAQRFGRGHAPRGGTIYLTRPTSAG